jgi:hypothetical protein
MLYFMSVYRFYGFRQVSDLYDKFLLPDNYQKLPLSTPFLPIALKNV